MPSVADRLQPRLILLSQDESLREEVRARLPERWQLTLELGAFDEVLVHRFVLLDLEAPGALDALRAIRSEMNLNIPVFCLGGDAAARDAARAARADRFFAREALDAMLPALCESFGW